MASAPIEYAVDDGIATIRWNAPDAAVNLVGAASLAAFAQAVRRALDDPAVHAAIVTSAKHDFVTGTDLREIFDPNVTNARSIDALQAALRAMETGGKPFVAALEGSALGAGADIALAAHHRIGTSERRARFGFPDVALGLIAGGGATQRLPRTIGIANALPLLLEGRTIGFAQAHELGIIDAVVPRGETVRAARAWLAANPTATQPWDAAGYRIPGGAVQTPKIAALFAAASATVQQKTRGNEPAPPAILTCVYEGLQRTFDAGLRVERRNCIALLRTPQAHAMVKTLHGALGAANALAARPPHVAVAKLRTIGVLGAGLMGAGIAYVSAEAGANVVLIDRDLALAQRGRANIQALLDRRWQRGDITEGQRDAILARIEASASYQGLAHADLVIEAVFEDRAIKADVTRRAEAVLSPRAIVATNTSTLPITGLAAASARPERFIGIHFFSPVERMPLVEIIRGAATGDEALAIALDFVRAIGKTPIVVNDRRGFFTSRVFSTYVQEGLAMLAEGVSPALIENAGRMAGMAVGPLVVADEVGLGLMRDVRLQTRADLGNAYVEGPGDGVIEQFVAVLDRPGKRAGKGFYDYPAAGRKLLWSGLADIFPRASPQPDIEEVKRRLLYVQSLEAVRAFEDGVIASAADGDLGSLLGWGFPAFTGGVFTLIEQTGAAAFTATCERLAAAHGARFEPPPMLRRLASSGEGFTGLDVAAPFALST